MLLSAARNFPQWLRRFWRPAYLPAVLAILVMAAVAAFAEFESRFAARHHQYDEVGHELGLLQARLAGSIEADTQLLSGLVATIEATPNMSQDAFAVYAAHIWPRQTRLLRVSAAPDFVIRFAYPAQPHAAWIGYDIRSDAERGPSALQARDLGKMVLAGPFDLRAGQGRAFVARFPVFAGEGSGRRFWGLVNAVVDENDLYRQSGLLDTNLPIELAISAHESADDAGQTFFGSPDIDAADPVVLDIPLPAGFWRLSAVPKGGWSGTPMSVWLTRLAVLFAAALIIIPTIVSGRLSEEKSATLTELQGRKTALSLLSHRLDLALDASHIGVWEVNTSSGEMFWDNRMNEIYGYPQDGAARDPTHWDRRIHPDDFQRAKREADEAIAAGSEYASEFRIVLDDGTVRHIRALAAGFASEGAALRMIGVNQDITSDVLLRQKLKGANDVLAGRNAELERATERIEHEARYDKLTDLPNRLFLEEALVAIVPGPLRRTGLLHIDLHRFRQVNDTLGYEAGDAVLKHFARLLKRGLGTGDIVTRVAADEFVILCTAEGIDNRTWRSRLVYLAENILANAKQPVFYEGQLCRVGLSIGIASDLDAVDGLTRLPVNADIALNRAQKRGANCYQFFTEAIEAEVRATQIIADDILEGLERGEFIPFYQPQFDASTLDIVGVEALARWQHPVKGLLPPAAFLPVAENLNVVAAIDKLILEQTLQDMEAWRRDGVGIPKASVNVSARRLNEDGLMKSLRQMNIPRGSLSFELLESIFMDEKDDLLSFSVEQIKDLGIAIEIDDFGTGYASILSLTRLMPNRLKIARPLIARIVESPAQRQLIGSIVNIGRSLGIEVLAEGVETMEHARILKELGCDALQGYALAKPMSFAALIAFVTARARKAAPPLRPSYG